MPAHPIVRPADHTVRATRTTPSRNTPAALTTDEVGGIVAARFTDARYFCWAPLHSLAEYRLEVEVAGRMLSRDEIRARYRLFEGGLGPDGPTWLEENSVRHVMDVVRQYELTYGQQDRARVEMRYRVNGGEEATWTWPPS